MDCDTCYAAGAPEGTCDHCIASGRHERVGRARPQPVQVRKRTGLEVFCDEYTKLLFGAPPLIPAVPANAPPEVVQRMGTFVLLKGFVAAVEAARVVLQAA